MTEQPIPTLPRIRPRPALTRLAIGLLACILLLPAARADDRPARELQVQLQARLNAMAAAALAGQPDDYLKHINAADPIFATEQKNWAADLAEHTPQHLEFMLAGDPVITGDTATAELRINWQMPGDRRRTTAYPVRFTRCDDAGWLVAGEDWLALDGDRIHVMYLRPFEPLAQSAVDVFPEVRQSVTAEMGLTDDADFAAHVQHIKIYPSMTHLQHSIYLSYTEPLKGWNEPGESIKLLASPGTGRRALRTVLAHEFGHVASFHYGPDAIQMPWWILEGIAELVAEPWARNANRVDRAVREWARTDDLRDWDDLADFRGEAMNHILHVYRQGQHMVTFITERYSAEARNRWMIAMANGADLDQATRNVLGISFAELDALWRKSIGARPRPQSARPPPASPPQLAAA